MKRILIMDTGSFKVFGGAAKTAYQTYEYLRNGKNCKVELFGDFSKVDNMADTASVQELKPDYYDVVLLNSVRDIPIVIKYLKPGASRTHFVYTDRGNVLQNFRMAGLGRLLPKMMLRQYFMLRMKGWLDCYVALSSDQYEYAKRFFSDQTKIKMVPNWYGKEFRLTGKTGKSEAAIYVGRLDERQKKVSFLIRGIARFLEERKEFRHKKILRLVGSGPDKEAYKRLVRSLGLEDNVAFYGFVDTERLVELYNSSIFFVSTSAWEGMAGTFIEAMACGLPLLINERNNTNLESWHHERLVTSKYNGLIYKYADLDDFARNLSELYLRPMFREKLARNAYKSSGRFGMNQNLRQYRKIVESFTRAG